MEELAVRNAATSTLLFPCYPQRVLRSRGHAYPSSSPIKQPLRWSVYSRPRYGDPPCSFVTRLCVNAIIARSARGVAASRGRRATDVRPGRRRVALPRSWRMRPRGGRRIGRSHQASPLRCAETASAASRPLARATVRPCEASGIVAHRRVADGGPARPRHRLQPAARGRHDFEGAMPVDSLPRLAVERVWAAPSAGECQYFGVRRIPGKEVVIGHECRDEATVGQRRRVPPALLDGLDERRRVLDRPACASRKATTATCAIPGNAAGSASPAEPGRSAGRIEEEASLGRIIPIAGHARASDRRSFRSGGRGRRRRSSHRPPRPARRVDARSGGDRYARRGREGRGGSHGV